MADEPQHGILNKTLGDVLQNNTQAQGMVMQAMQISPQQLQEMLKATGNNQLMNMSIGDLFKNGVVQQATQMGGQPVPVGGQVPSTGSGPGPGQVISGGQAQQISPEQMQQIMGVLQNGQSMPAQGQTIQSEQNPVVPVQVEQKETFLQKIKNLFK